MKPENERKSFGFIITGILLGAFLTILGCFGKTFRNNSHEYTIHNFRNLARPKRPDWRHSQENCLKNGSHLVCIELQEELDFLVRKLEELKLANESEYFIGLQKQSSGWTWICNTSIGVTQYQLPWSGSKPSGNGNCTKMFFGTKKSPSYDDIPCSEQFVSKILGYICERRISSGHGLEGGVTTHNKQSTPLTSIQTSPVNSDAPESTITATKPHGEEGGVTTHNKQSTPITSIQTSPVNSDAPESTITATKPHGEGTNHENPGENVKNTSDGNSRLIIIAVSVLALIILVICVLLWFFCIHQPRIKASNSKCRRPEDQQLKNCTQLRERVVCPPPEEKMDEYEDIHEMKPQNTIANISPLVQEQKALIQAQSSDGYLVPFDESTPAGTSEKSDVLSGDTKIGQERQHVYAVVNIDNKQGKVTFHKGLVMQDGDTCPTDSGGNYNPSVDLSSLGLENDVTKSEAAKANECKDYLYAVVHKTEKKRQPPQMPAPYHGLLYADLSHSTEKSDGKITRANLPTVYADIDHLKTDAMSESRFPQLNEDQLTDGPG